MVDDQWANWRFLLSSTAIELFDHYGVTLHDEPHWTPVLGEGEHVAGSVYFGGDRIQGALTVCATRDLLGRATPVPPELPIPLSDFAREIANQILGGLKSRLIRHGIDFSYEFADPATQLPETALGGDARTLVLQSSGGEVALMFVVTSNIDLQPVSDAFPQEVPQGPGGVDSPMSIPASMSTKTEIGQRGVKTVLVIDDSETIRAHVGTVLRGAGYEVLEASDGLMGAFTIRERAADLALVICDINMPRLDGLEMLEVLRGQYPKLPILMLTTESRVDKVERAKKAGAKAWIIKPFKPELLVEAVTKLTAVTESPSRIPSP